MIHTTNISYLVHSHYFRMNSQTSSVNTIYESKSSRDDEDDYHLSRLFVNNRVSLGSKRAPCASQPDSHHRVTSQHHDSSELTAFHSVYALGARIPPELFQKILEHVATWDNGWSTSSFEDARQDLRNCSLVCVFWAEYCRRVLYRECLLPRIQSWRQAVAMADALLEGKSGRLTPFKQLLKGVHVELQPRSAGREDDDRPWLHLLFSLSLLREMLPQSTLDIDHRDYVLPPHITLTSFNSPHWSLPRSVPPSCTPYRRIDIQNMRFHSFSKFIKFIGHFTSAEEFRFLGIKWDVDDSAVVTPQRSFTVRRRPLKAIYSRGCTDNMLVCLQAIKQSPASKCSSSPWTQRTVSEFVLAILAALENGEHWRVVAEVDLGGESP